MARKKLKPKNEPKMPNTLSLAAVDARQSLMLARPAIPLAACVYSPSCTTLACSQQPTLQYVIRMLSAI